MNKMMKQQQTVMKPVLDNDKATTPT